MIRTWIRRVGIVALVGGYCLTGYGLRSTLAATDPPGEEDSSAGIAKNWDKKLPNTLRFTVLTDFDGAAVRDNETGLVWEQSPETKTQNWSGARFACASRTIGGRKGWRLPSVHELASLVDPAVVPGPLCRLAIPLLASNRLTIGRRLRSQASLPSRGTLVSSWAWCTT